MSKMFKAGDKVRCLRSYSDQFTEGKIYTVSRFVAPTVIVELDDIGSTTNGFHMDCFEKVEIMKVKDIKVGMKFKSLKYKDGTCSKGLSLEKGIAEVTDIHQEETSFRLEFRDEYGDYIDFWWHTKAVMKKALKKGWLVPIEEEVTGEATEAQNETPEPPSYLFKAGDKVRALTDGSYLGTVEEGEMYEVLRVSPKTNGVYIKVKGHAQGLYMWESEVELVKEELKEELKAGDIIRITEDCEVDWGYYLKGELRSVNLLPNGGFSLVKLDDRHEYWVIDTKSLSELKYELVEFE